MKILQLNQNDIDQTLFQFSVEEKTPQILIEKEIKSIISLEINCDGSLFYDEKFDELGYPSHNNNSCTTLYSINKEDILVHYFKADDECRGIIDIFNFYFICPVCGNFTLINESILPDKWQEDILINYKNNLLNQKSLYAQIIDTRSIREQRQFIIKESVEKVKTYIKK